MKECEESKVEMRILVEKKLALKFVLWKKMILPSPSSFFFFFFFFNYSNKM